MSTKPQPKGQGRTRRKDSIVALNAIRRDSVFGSLSEMLGMDLDDPNLSKSAFDEVMGDNSESSAGTMPEPECAGNDLLQAISEAENLSAISAIDEACKEDATDEETASTGMMVQIECPEGCQPGDLVSVLSPDGSGIEIEVAIPNGIEGGMAFSVNLAQEAESSASSRDEDMFGDKTSMKRQQTLLNEVATPQLMTGNLPQNKGSGNSTLQVLCPDGVNSGDVLTVQIADGHEVEVEIPVGMKPGMEFEIVLEPELVGRLIKDEGKQEAALHGVQSSVAKELEGREAELQPESFADGHVLHVVCPEDGKPGDILTVQTDVGNEVQVQIPTEIEPGMKFEIHFTREEPAGKDAFARQSDSQMRSEIGVSSPGHDGVTSRRPEVQPEPWNSAIGSESINVVEQEEAAMEAIEEEDEQEADVSHEVQPRIAIETEGMEAEQQLHVGSLNQKESVVQTSRSATGASESSHGPCISAGSKSSLVTDTGHRAAAKAAAIERRQAANAAAAEQARRIAKEGRKAQICRQQDDLRREQVEGDAVDPSSAVFTRLFTGSSRQSQNISDSNVRTPSPRRRSSTNGKGQTASPIFQRLTDSSLYTGAHKHRFGKDGKGLGADGRRDRENIPTSTDLAEIMRPELRTGSQRNSPSEQVRSSKGTTATRKSSVQPRRSQRRVKAVMKKQRRQATNATHDALSMPSAAEKSASQSHDARGVCAQGREHRSASAVAKITVRRQDKLFAKLCDPGRYTGTHKYRYRKAELEVQNLWESAHSDAFWLDECDRAKTDDNTVSGDNNIANSNGAGTDTVISLLPVTATAIGTSAVFGKLTNPKLYTGLHKHRFDGEGNGRGRDPDRPVRKIDAFADTLRAYQKDCHLKGSERGGKSAALFTNRSSVSAVCGSLAAGGGNAEPYSLLKQVRVEASKLMERIRAAED